MKKKIIFAFIIFLVISPSVEALEWWPWSKLKEQEKKIESLEKKIEFLKKEQEIKIKEKDAENKRLEDKIKRSNEIDVQTNDGKNKGKNNDRGLVQWFIIPIFLILVGLLCFVFWPLKTKATPVSPNKNKCPRCGWEHDPGDTVCKNPNCRTQF